MKLGGALQLAARSGAALGRICVDRVAEPFGLALPRTPEQLARVEVLDRLLGDYAPGSGRILPALTAAGLAGVEFESSNCTNFLIDVEFDTGPASDPLPSAIYAKMPCPEFATRVFGNAVGFWPLECFFCANLAHRVPIRVPRVYAAARQGARFVLLLENLQELPGARLFSNREMAAGTTVERARLVLDTFARLHAAFWGADEAEREALLPVRFHTNLSPPLRRMTRALNASAIAPAHRAAPDLFDEELVGIAEMAIDKWDALVRAWYAGPLTLCHGDSHLGNCFEYPTDDGVRIGMIDFQGVHWGKGIRDVQYFLSDSLAPELLERHEASLIDHYLDALAGRGVRVDPDHARADYLALSFQTLMVAFVSVGLGSLTETDATVRTVLERAVASVRRLGFGDWLRAL